MDNVLRYLIVRTDSDDLFMSPEPEEAPKAEEPAEAPAEEAPAEEKAEAPAKEAKREPLKLDPKLEGYLEEVKTALVKDFGLAEDAAKKKLEESGLADQLTAFPYLMNKAAKDAAEKLK